MRLTTGTVALVGLSGLLAGGCRMGPVGEMQTITRSVELDQAESVDVDLKMAAGELRVSGGARKLTESTFRFNVPQVGASRRLQGRCPRLAPHSPG